MKKECMNLVWATDEKYVYITEVSITSALENNRDYEEVRVFVISEKLSDASKEIIENSVKRYGRKTFFVDAEEKLEEIKSTGARGWGKNEESYSTYSRIFIADILNEFNVNRCIYCDSDLIINGSLDKIINYDLCGKTIGLAKEYMNFSIREILNLPDNSSYYQMGFMLIDLRKWRENNCTEKVVNHMRYVCSIYPFVDQDLINCVLHDEICNLPLAYNVNQLVSMLDYENICWIYSLDENTYYNKNEFINGKNNIVVFHCSGPYTGKPWDLNNWNPYNDIWRKYYDLSIVREQFILAKRKKCFADCLFKFIYERMPRSFFCLCLKLGSNSSFRKLKKVQCFNMKKVFVEGQT